MRERVELEAVMFSKPTAVRRPTVQMSSNWHLILSQYKDYNIAILHKPCISTDVVTSSCPDGNWAIQVVLVLLYARGIFVKFNLPMPIPKSLLNSVVIIISSMSSIIVLFTSHWTPVIVGVRVTQTRETLPCGVVTRSSGSILTVNKKSKLRLHYG